MIHLPPSGELNVGRAKSIHNVNAVREEAESKPRSLKDTRSLHTTLSMDPLEMMKNVKMVAKELVSFI